MGKIPYNGTVSTGTPIRICTGNAARQKFVFQNISDTIMVLYFLLSPSSIPTVGTTTPSLSVGAGGNIEVDATDAFDPRNDIWVTCTGVSKAYEAQAFEG